MDGTLRFCLCVHNDEMRSEVYAYGAARSALKALEVHRMEAKVQEAGCWLLKELAEHMASCKARHGDVMGTPWARNESSTDGAYKDRATFSAAIQAALKALEKCAHQADFIRS
eukprot:Skav211957  [mRNA]  locus=scaffold1559:171824:174625:- [translate_table: standard]